jgi:hypothetical protein
VGVDAVWPRCRHVGVVSAVAAVVAGGAHAVVGRDVGHGHRLNGTAQGVPERDGDSVQIILLLIASWAGCSLCLL